jgi:hypothetical protein
LGDHKRRLRTALSHDLTTDRLEQRQTGCCSGPFRLALRKEAAGVCPVSRMGIHAENFTGRVSRDGLSPDVPSVLRCARMRLRIRDISPERKRRRMRDPSSPSQ